MKDITPEKLLTPDEAAEAFGVKAKTIREWLKAGELKGYKTGRLWRISEEAIKDFLEKNANKK